MQTDFLTLACLRDHLDGLLGARVQQVVLPDDRTVALELYAEERIHLLVSAKPQAPRILIVPDKPRRGVERHTALLLLLRKWVRGARLTDVTQPPWERIVILEFSGRAGDCQLVAELMGRNSNIVLVGPNGAVLDAAKHIGPRQGRRRTMLPGRPYELPPLPPNRVPPTRLSEADWTRKMTSVPADAPLHRWLTGAFLGFSPTVAREVAARATGNAEALANVAAPHAVFEAVTEVFAPLANGWWAPHVALDENGDVIAFTAYEPRQFDRVESEPDINIAMWRYFEGQGMADPYGSARRTIQTLLNDARARLDRRWDQMQSRLIGEEDATELRVAGELLLAYQAQVADGAEEVSLPDYHGGTRTIPLDPNLTPVANAQRYFRRYEKARRAARQIPTLMESLKTERAYLDQLGADLLLAETRPEIDAVYDALAAAGWVKKPRKTVAHIDGPRRFEVDGFSIWVGRNARQNELLTFHRAAPDDLWLHARGLPGAHVLIKRGRQDVPDKVIQRAAEMAAYFSKARRGGGQVDVDITERRFVRRVRGKYPGLVTYRNERTVRATAEYHDWEQDDSHSTVGQEQRRAD